MLVGSGLRVGVAAGVRVAVAVWVAVAARVAVAIGDGTRVTVTGANAVEVGILLPIVAVAVGAGAAQPDRKENGCSESVMAVRVRAAGTRDRPGRIRRGEPPEMFAGAERRVKLASSYSIGDESG